MPSSLPKSPQSQNKLQKEHQALALDPEPPLKFPQEEEAALLAECNDLKTQANTLFSRSEFSQAISIYDQALSHCPNYLEYEVAVLHSNIAACHLRLSEWKAAVDSATLASDGLARELPLPGVDNVKKDGSDEDQNGKVVELDNQEDDVASQMERLILSDERKAKIQSLRAKSLLRRAKANVGQGGWSAFAAAESDYKLLSIPPLASILPTADQKFVRQQLMVLPAKVKEAQEKEVGEMMGKLKDLGNGLLKPFGLSTDMFNFVKDEATGGYSMNFGKKD